MIGVQLVMELESRGVTLHTMATLPIVPPPGARLYVEGLFGQRVERIEIHDMEPAQPMVVIILDPASPRQPAVHAESWLKRFGWAAHGWVPFRPEGHEGRRP